MCLAVLHIQKRISKDFKVILLPKGVFFGEMWTFWGYFGSTLRVFEIFFLKKNPFFAPTIGSIHTLQFTAPCYAAQCHTYSSSSNIIIYLLRLKCCYPSSLKSINLGNKNEIYNKLWTVLSNSFTVIFLILLLLPHPPLCYFFQQYRIY